MPAKHKIAPFNMIHAGEFRGNALWHSEDEGEFWWSGWMFSHDTQVTREELIEMAVSILRDISKPKKGKA